MSEIVIVKLLRMHQKLNVLRLLNILFVDEISQVSAELPSVLDIILRRIRDINIFMGGLLMIATMDHAQLQPIQGRPFLLSSHIITCFKMEMLKSSVRSPGDVQFQRLQDIARMHYKEYEENPELLDKFKNLLSETCTFVDSWSLPVITPSTYRLYG